MSAVGQVAVSSRVPFVIRCGAMCMWCSRSISAKPREGMSACKRCRAWFADPERQKRFDRLRYALVEVLTPAAAEIVRAFSTAAQREYDFTPVLVEESRQMQLLWGWRTEKVRAEPWHVETKSGRWVGLWEEHDVPVPFTLRIDENAVKAFDAWWKKAMKVAKGRERPNAKHGSPNVPS